MRNELLKLLATNARYTVEQLAVMLAATPEAVAAEIDTLQKEGVICGYKTVIDWEKVDDDRVNALIELSIIPQRDSGFDKVAERIANYPEVKSLYLMSGGYDLAVFVEGKTMKEVAFFVARKLASLNEVTATATHFVLTKFKEKGVMFGRKKKDERGNL